MPRIKRVYRRKKRSTKKKLRKSSRRFQKPGRRLPLPITFRRTLRYMEAGLALDPGVAGVAADNVFVATGLYDPNLTGGGHQPMGFDQLMAMYNNYTVIGAKVQVTFSNNDATYPQFVGITLTKESTAVASGMQQIEQGETTWAMLSPSTGSKSVATLTKGFSTKRMHGGNVMGEDTLAGTASANPNSNWYFHVWADPNNGVNTSSVYAHVIIEYIAVFSDIKNMSQS